LDKRLRKVILYGSRARGEAKEDSDIDLAIVLEGGVVPGEEIDRMVDIITEVNLKYSCFDICLSSLGGELCQG